MYSLFNNLIFLQNDDSLDEDILEEDNVFSKMTDDEKIDISYSP